MTKQKPHAQRDELHAPTDFRELFRYKKADRTRAYQLRVLNENNAELWVVSEGGQKPRSRLLVTFTNPDDVVPFLESIEQDLRAGGWGCIGGR